MTDTADALAALLNQRHIDGAHLEHTVRFLVAQWSDFKSPGDMRSEMLDSGIKPDTLMALQVTLTDDPALLDEAALAVLAVAWQDRDLHDAAAGSLDEAQSRLPVIEIGAIVVSVMYGMWLMRTGGKRSTTKTVRKGADGSYEETESTQWYDPTGPLRAVVDLIRTPTAPPELSDPSSPPALPESAPNPSGE